MITEYMPSGPTIPPELVELIPLMLSTLLILVTIAMAMVTWQASFYAYMSRTLSEPRYTGPVLRSAFAVLVDLSALALVFTGLVQMSVAFILFIFAFTAFAIATLLMCILLFLRTYVDRRLDQLLKLPTST